MDAKTFESIDKNDTVITLLELSLSYVTVILFPHESLCIQIESSPHAKRMLWPIRSHNICGSHWYWSPDRQMCLVSQVLEMWNLGWHGSCASESPDPEKMITETSFWRRTLAGEICGLEQMSILRAYTLLFWLTKCSWRSRNISRRQFPFWRSGGTRTRIVPDDYVWWRFYSHSIMSLNASSWKFQNLTCWGSDVL